MSGAQYWHIMACRFPPFVRPWAHLHAKFGSWGGIVGGFVGIGEAAAERHAARMAAARRAHGCGSQNAPMGDKIGLGGAISKILGSYLDFHVARWV